MEPFKPWWPVTTTAAGDRELAQLCSSSPSPIQCTIQTIFPHAPSITAGHGREATCCCNLISHWRSGRNACAVRIRSGCANERHSYPTESIKQCSVFFYEEVQNQTVPAHGSAVYSTLTRGLCLKALGVVTACSLEL